MTRLHVSAQLLLGGQVLLEIGAPPDGPHWVISRADAEALGWALIDAATGHQLPAGLAITDLHHPDVTLPGHAG